jgi:serine/threonine-protein kinase PknG
VSGDDAGAGYLATITATDPAQLIAQLRAAPERTLEVDLRLAAATIEDGSLEQAEALLDEIESTDPWEWRVGWYRGITELARRRAEFARQCFETVYAASPGELAPKLALGLACETAGDLPGAVRWYEIVARTDPSITSASFGLARCRLQVGDRAGALEAYERVPDTSSGHMDAQTARISCISVANGSASPRVEDLLAAGTALEALPLDVARRARLSADLLEAALGLTLTGKAFDDGRIRLLGRRLTVRDLRVGLENCYRELARHAATRAERIALVDDANRVRPRTWV